MIKKFPKHGWVGLILMLLFWGVNWGMDGLRTHWAFFPMWLGYTLVMDGLVYIRKPGKTIYSRSKLRFASLFLVSMPFWWLFELIDLRTNYWIYSARAQFTDLEYFLYASWCFSTVIPAMFESADLITTFKWSDRFKKMGKLNLDGRLPLIFFVSGWVLLAFTLWKPEYSPAFLWMSLYFICDPINLWLGYPSLLKHTEKGDWKKVVCLAIGSLICGFFWEFWNFYSSPKWFYNVPYVDFWYVFEMPLLGYLGYIPFAFELYAIYHLTVGLFNSPTKMENLL